MSRLVALSDLRLQSRQRADKVNSGFILDSELNSYINASATELYDLLTSAYGNDYFFKEYDFNTNGSDIDYSLPSDFYKMIGLDLYLNASRFITLKPYMWNERGMYQDG